jgi:hypothetical protein
MNATVFMTQDSFDEDFFIPVAQKSRAKDISPDALIKHKRQMWESGKIKSTNDAKVFRGINIIKDRSISPRP